MNIWQTVAFLCVVISVTKGQNIRPGTCASINAAPISSFNMSRYAGEWFEIQRYEKQSDVDCATVKYVLAGTTNYTITDSGIVLSNRDGYVTIRGAQLANVTANPPVGLLTVYSVIQGVTTSSEYRILHTDYDSYAIAYSCKTENATTISESAWILSRQTSFTPGQETTVNSKLATTPIDTTKLRRTEQNNYICTTSMACGKNEAPLVENFNATRYLGLWYEISRYEKNFQSGGDCVTALYNINTGPAGGISVNNYMIRLNNRAALSASGVAQLADATGNPLYGLLTVSFNTTGVPTNSEYRIMATDYDNYAIVYSCKNVLGTLTFDSAWVLSRGSTFSEATERQVNTLIQVSKINQANLRKTEQDRYICNTPTACSKTDAPVVENFDATKYLGGWYEISRYEPQDLKTNRDCATSNYSTINLGNIRANYTWKYLNNRTIVNQQATAVVANAIGRPVLGLMKITQNLSGEEEYRILATDYTSYSVVYSCKNILGTKSYGTAWILSRNRTLATTSEAYTKINSVPNAINKTLIRITEQDPAKCSSATLIASIITLIMAFTIGQLFNM